MTTLCRSCKSSMLTPIISLGNQYLSDFREDDTKPAQYPIDVIMCNTCTLLQLNETTPPSEMYHARYGYYSGVNQTMRTHLQGVVQEAILRSDLHDGDVVVDIGSNDATLLKNYPENLTRVGFDPVSKFAPFYEGITFVNDYFNKASYPLKKKAKVITAISMFYDLEEPNAFVRDLKDMLDEYGLLIIQQNYLAEMIGRNAYDNICHEHLEFYSLASLEHLLARHGLHVYHVETNSLNGGSFRVYVQHEREDRIEDSSVMEMRVRESKLKLDKLSTYKEFAQRIERLRDRLYDFIQSEHAKGKSFYVYGASTRGNTLLQFCGLDATLITAAVERNPEKWGKKIASSGIPIISEEQARAEKPDYFLMLPYFFKEEFIEREKDFVKQGGHLLFPLPEMDII